MRPLLLLLATLLATLTASAQVPSYVPTDGLVSWYPFNGNTLDYSGLENHGNNVGTAFDTDRFNTENSSVFFSGTGADYIEVPHSSSLAFATGDPISWSIWVFNLPDENPGSYFEKWAGSGGDSYPEFRARRNAEGTAFSVTGYCSNLGGGTGTVGASLETQAWTFFTYVSDGDSARLYRNAELAHLVALSNPGCTNTLPLYIGKRGGTNNRNHHGKLDDFGVWNRALNENEVLSLFLNAEPIFGCTDSDACVFDANTNVDDGSCTYPGCTDSEACNFDVEAGCDDGSCVYPPLVELGANTTLCEGEALELSAGAPGLTTTWSTGVTGTSISVTETGTYSVQSGGEFGADYRLEFDGVDDYISFGSSLNLTTYPFSIQADISVPSDYWPILYTDDGTDGYSGIWFEIGPDIFSIAVGEGSGSGPNNRRSKSGSHGLQAGATTTVSAVVRGATDMSLYVNSTDIGGNYSGSGNTTFIDNGLDAVIGRYTPSSGTLLNQLVYQDGTLDNLHVWTKALTAEEVAQVVDNPAGGDEDGLLAVYTFDEGAGAISTDGANGVEAQLFGNPTWVLEEEGCSTSDTITVHVIDCESLCGPGTTWNPILQSCVSESPEANAAEDCSLFILQELSTGYLNQQQQMTALDTIIVTQQAAIDSLNALLNNCPGND